MENPDDPESWRAAVRPNTKAFFGESISNPKNDFLDIEAVAAVAHEVGVPLIVDNTVATPVPDPAVRVGRRHRHPLRHQVLRRPRHGYRRRDHRRRAPSTTPSTPSASRNYNQPDPSYHGLVYARDLGVGSAFGANLSFILKARVQLLRDLGAAISPFNAFLIAQGIETLSLRIERHVENAKAWRKVARGPRRGRVGQLRRAHVEPVA